ncbi:hypothetical protein ES703_12385 [subsurface metagenome]
MIEHYQRKLQRHGTGNESRVPPEICKHIEIQPGEDMDYIPKPGIKEATIRKAGTDQQQFDSPMDPEKMITLFFNRGICIIAGRPGCGKRSFAKKFCQDRKRVIFYDPVEPGRYVQGVPIDNLKEFEHFLIDITNFNFRAIYNPRNSKREFDSICELVNKSKNLTFWVENLDLYCESPVSRPLKELIKNGLRNNIELIGITEKPQAIDKRLISYAERGPQLSEPKGPQRKPDFDVLASDER